MTGNPVVDTSVLLDRLVDEIAARLQNDEPVELPEYCSRYPSCADQLRQLFPALRMLRGQSAESFHAAVTRTRITKRSEFYFFGKAHADVDQQGRLGVQMLPGQESFKISPLAQANCWAIVRDGADEISAGDLIEIAPLYPASFLQ